MNIKLRPHHLLCTQGFAGRGYDDNFVANMTEITDCLRNGDDIGVDIVFGTDSICGKCPNLVENPLQINENFCKHEDKVRRFDRKVIEYFNIEEKRYIYRDIIQKINSEITGEIISDICAECVWFSVSECRNLFTNQETRPV